MGKILEPQCFRNMGPAVHLPRAQGWGCLDWERGGGRGHEEPPGGTGRPGAEDDQQRLPACTACPGASSSRSEDPCRSLGIKADPSEAGSSAGAGRDARLNVLQSPWGPRVCMALRSLT